MAFDPAGFSSDNDDEERVDALAASVPKLRIDDAFDADDKDDADDVNGFDLKTFVGLARREAANGDDETAREEDAEPSPVSTMGSSVLGRNGRPVPPALTLVTTGPSPALPQLDDDDLRNTGRREQFEDISLSPPASPLSTTSHSHNQVPVPVADSELNSPLKSPNPLALSTSNPRMKSVTSLALPGARSSTIRVVSPRPNYLSPTSTIPTPQAVDPIPQRAPSPSPNSKRVSENPALRTRPSTAPGGGRVIPGNHTGATTSAALADKLLSKTRPAHLPPKPRSEDLKHQREFEEMMKRSRAFEEERVKKEREKKLEREGRVEDATSVWEREILPDWRRVLRPGKDSERLRRMWWGGVPGKLRGRVWAAAIGNGLALSKGIYPSKRSPLFNQNSGHSYIHGFTSLETYRTCSSRAKRALSAGTFPAETLAEIEGDVRHTLPNLHIFHPEYGPMYQDLRDILCAWVVSRSDEGLGYVRISVSIPWDSPA